MVKRLRPTLSLLALTFCLLVSLTPSPAAAQSRDSEVAPLQDTYVSRNAPDQQLNKNALLLSFDNLGGFTPSDFSYLQFDLRGASSSIAESLLEMTIVVNNTQADEVTIGLYAVSDDGWNESDLVFNNRPVPGARLQSVTVAGDATGPVTFGDSTGTHPLGTWLEQERQGDGVATLMLGIDSAANPGFIQGTVVIEDSENSHDAATGDQPNLTLAGPTAITLEGARADDTSSLPATLLLAALLLVGATTGLTVKRRQHRAP